MNKKIFSCPYCESTWKIDVDQIKIDNQCPFCHHKFEMEKSFRVELKKIIDIYGEKLFLNPTRFYALCLDLVDDYEKEKRLFNILISTKIFEVIYNNRTKKEVIHTELIKIHEKCFLDLESIEKFSNDLLYALGFDQKNKKEMRPEDYYQAGLKYQEENDYENAFLSFEKAAESGHREAEYELGKCYYDALGVEQDYKLAFYWFKEAASKGHEQAMIMVGVCYQKGHGVNKNEKEAFKRYHLVASLKKDKYALYLVGMCYLDGVGTEKDIQKAKKYLQESLDSGYEPASEVLNKINK